MSFQRSTMESKPSSSTRAASPVCSQPSVNDDALVSGLFQ
jgi:hypothetical protein